MRLRGPRGGPDRGSIAPAVPIIALVLLLLGGLVIDASRQLNARGRAVAYAEEAARAGASAVDLSTPALQLLPEEAVRARVEDYCAAARQADPLVTCTWVGIEPVSDDDPRPLVVHVSARIVLPASLLGIVGVSRLTASGEGRARPIEGIHPDDTVNPLQ